MIRLDTFTESDFSRLISWISSREMLMQFGGPLFIYPLTTHQLTIYCTEQNRFPFKVIDDSLNKVIGHAEIFLPEKQKAVFCRLLIGDSAERNKGYGSQLVQKLLGICFVEMDIQEINLNVYDWNKNAIRCYEKTGFQINEGKTRKTVINDQEWTALNMIISKPQWMNHSKSHHI